MSRSVVVLTALAAVISLPGLAGAQQVARPPVAADSVFVRAQQLVAAGQGDSGRAIVQHELESAKAGSDRYVEALYWRGALAKTAADAERDFKQIIIDYPLSARQDDALIQLAQLETTRGDRAQALVHLERIVREHPNSPARPRASFWIARVLLDEDRLPRACVYLADARRTVPSSDIELRNQVDYFAQRCAGVDTSVVVSSLPPASSPPVTSPPVGSPPTTVAPPPTVAAPPVSASTTPVVIPKKTPPPLPAAAGGKDSTATRSTSKGAGVPPSATKAKPATASRHTAREYTVQVAAYNTRAAAEALSQSMKGRGYDARVVQSGSVYRVRIGRYGARGEAAALLRELKAKHIDGFIADVEPR